MKMEAYEALRLIVAAINDTNKTFRECAPTIPQWTSSFAYQLEKRLDEALVAP